ncbi:N-6 DNA methylase [Caballeronia sp. GACF4]|uniref:N-6 DNA methylase n=1 Tax=Caballeronia sp. GACF4 TaxID=2921763 RepID=UPI002027DC5D
MKEKENIVWQIIDRVRGALDPWHALELVLQVLVWEKWSNEGRLPASLSFNKALDLQGCVEIWQQLGRHDAAFKQVFPDSRTLALSGASTLQATLEVVHQLRETGMLKTDDVTDLVVRFAGNNSGEVARPPELADLMVAMGRIQPGNTLYAPWDSSAQLSVRCAQRGAHVYLETPIPSPLPTLIGLLTGSTFDVHHSDPISAPTAIENGKLHRFDLAIAFPPLNQRYDNDVVTRDWFGRFPEKTQSGTVLAIRHLLAYATNRIVVAVAPSLLFGRGAEHALRADLVHRGIVETVVAMPGGCLIGTNIPFALLVLNPRGGHQTVRFINADQDQFREPLSKARTKLVNTSELMSFITGQRDEDDGVAVISITEILDNDAQLQVGRYVLPVSQKRLQIKMASVQQVSLGDLVTTIRPVPTKQANDGDRFNVWEIGASDLPPFGYIQAPVKSVSVERHAVQPKQYLMPYDIVLIVKGSVGKLGIVPPNVPPPGPGGWVAGVSAIVLRVDRKDVEPRALALQLRSPLGQALLHSIVSGGTTIQMINMHELNRLAVWLPPLEEALDAAQALEEEARIQEEINRLSCRQSEVAAGLWTLD